MDSPFLLWYDSTYSCRKEAAYGYFLIDMIDLFYLKTFVTVTKTGSFRIAAERNAITQPAVSQHIRVLERQLDTRLFERQGKGIALTPAGKIFLPYAENILTQYEEARTRVKETEGTFFGTIRIATIYSIGLYALNPIIRRFLKKYPQVNLHLEYQKNTTIYEMVLNRSVDFGLVAFPQKRKGLVTERFLEDELALVQSPTNRTIKKKSARLIDLEETKFVMFSTTTPTGKAIAQFFSSKGVHPNILHEYDNIELIKSSVALGLGCALLPKSTIAKETKNGTLEVLPLEELDIKRPLGILYHAGKSFTKSARTFYQMLTS